MHQESFRGFIVRHRFKLRDIADGRHSSKDEIRLTRAFPSDELLTWHLQSEELRKLFIALALGSHMAECDTDDHDAFARLSSKLNEEQWGFALRFCPYHDVSITLDNLALIQSAMDEAYLGLTRALAGMDATFGGPISNASAYNLEKSRATSNLINFTALYATYVDSCRRIRKLVKMDRRESYDRAIRRLIATNSGHHSFIKEYRNFQFHYRITEPFTVTRMDGARQSNLCLSSNELIQSGYRWQPATRTFLKCDERVDVIATAAIILRDVKRLIRFHRKLAERRLRREKFAYDTYRHERDRHNHLQSSRVDIGAIFRRPSSLVERLLDQSFVESIVNSALSDDEAFEMLVRMADRHRNLSSDVKKSLATQIRAIVERRPNYPRADAYLQGRKDV